MEKINQVELRLRRIEDIGASSQRSPPSIVPNQQSNSRYPQSMPTYRQPWSEIPYRPRPLMEILTSQPPVIIIDQHYPFQWPFQ